MNKHKILIVDDSEFNRKVLSSNLCDEYDIIEANNGLAALEIIEKDYSNISLMILDIMMPELNGIELLKILNERKITKLLPIILITAADSNEEYAFKLGAVDFIAKPFNLNVAKSRIETHIHLKIYRDELEQIKRETVLDCTHFCCRAFETAISLVQYRDIESIGNTTKIREITYEFLNRLKLEDEYKTKLSIEECRNIVFAVMARDMGKLMLSGSILYKKDGLAEEEKDIYKNHIEFGSRVFKHMEFDDEKLRQICIDVCLYHHENWNGSGYPSVLSGEDIPYTARIAAIIDSYDAHVMKNGCTYAAHESAVSFIRCEKGKMFDPFLSDIFIGLKNLEKNYIINE